MTGFRIKQLLVPICKQYTLSEMYLITIIKQFFHAYNFEYSGQNLFYINFKTGLKITEDQKKLY